MEQNWRKLLFLTAGLFLGSFWCNAQQSTERVITIEELFRLVKENYPSLKVSKADIEIAKRNTEVVKNQMLPQINAGLQASYIGDVYLFDKNFSNGQTVDMPHFGNKFSVDASQLIWKGNAVRNGIKVYTLQEELAALNYEANEQSIKLLVVGYYLDMYKLYNQETVYIQNIKLAEQRLTNINKYYHQGMVTRNDVIRGELQLSNLRLMLQVLNNNQQILNKQLTVTLGLPDSVKIVPDKNITQATLTVTNLDSYENLAQNHPLQKLTHRSIDAYDITAKITKAEFMPSLSAFAGNGLQRPLTSSSPALDMYSNSWSTGLSLNFNIDAFFKTPRKLQLNKAQKEKAIAQANETSQMIEVAVNAAYIKYNEALTQNKTLKTNTELAAENYRIMESKYNNQLAILLDILDASNAKLDAELQFANSEITIIYSYYKLLKETGTLN